MNPACQLYQLCSKRELPAGAYVEVNGPFDSHGVILSSSKQDDATFLNLIRGVPKDASRKPAYRF